MDTYWWLLCTLIVKQKEIKGERISLVRLVLKEVVRCGEVSIDGNGEGRKQP